MTVSEPGQVRKCAIWARVSTTDQHAENQLVTLRAWAATRGLEVAAEFVTEDSAWWQPSGTSNGAKGKEFDAARKALLAGAHLGTYSVVLTWALDRMSRKGPEDTLAILRQLYERDSDVWSYQEPWLETSDPRMRELLVSIFGWLAGQESARRSARIREGLDRRRRDGKQVGGRKQGSKDKKPRSREGYQARWERERQRERQPDGSAGGSSG
jgi:putative DNA-invertase from lambdoid prophage Rac